jgi:hypothetical protein
MTDNNDIMMYGLSMTKELQSLGINVDWNILRQIYRGNLSELISEVNDAIIYEPNSIKEIKSLFKKFKHEKMEEARKMFNTLVAINQQENYSHRVGLIYIWFTDDKKRDSFELMLYVATMVVITEYDREDIMMMTKQEFKSLCDLDAGIRMHREHVKKHFNIESV